MSKNKGGHAADSFVFEHFTPVGERTQARRWNMRCNYCPDSAAIIIHRDSHCVRHLSTAGSKDGCPNAPADVRAEARARLMKKGGMEIPAEVDSDIEIIEQEPPAPGSSKKAKTSADTSASTGK